MSYIFKRQDWENYLQINVDKLNIIAVENPNKLWEYAQELSGQSCDEVGDFIICKYNWEQLQFNKIVNVEINLGGLALNSKKIQTALLKKTSLLVTNLDNEFEYKDLLHKVYEFCKHTSLDIGYSVELDEDFESSQVFKIFNLRMKENYKSFLDKLMAFIHVNIEFFGVKVFSFLFLCKYLTEEELINFFQFCKYQEVSLILFEDNIPKFSEKFLDYHALIIDNDLCEIIK